MLRFWNLGRVGFRGDEAVYAGQAAVLAGDHSMTRYFILASRGNSNFLLFQEIVSFFYRIFGVGDVTPRLISAAFSLATVLVVYLIGRILYSHRTALFGAAVLAVSSYAIGLGRLALLDASATFFVSLAVLFLALWHRSYRTVWLCAFAAACAFAVQAKVTGGLLPAVFVAGLALAGTWRRLRVRAVGWALLTGLAALTPAIIQLFLQGGAITAFLGTSLHRHSPVSWDYYGGTLMHYEGLAGVCIVVLGLLLAASKPRHADIVPWTWLLIFGLFDFIYPLKAFNYLMPLMPALALLVGRGLEQLAFPRALPARFKSLRGPAWLAVPASLTALAVVAVTPHLASAMHDDSSGGVREASRWLAENTPKDAGILALSQGSAQYAYSFYANRAAYPYGRFRLDTVLPGPRVVSSRDTPKGRLPLEWISDYPPRLIQNGTVSYLVYATGTLDDPPEENQIVGTLTQRQYRSLIESYGGQLVHTVRWHNEGRVYIYRVTRRLSKPTVSFAIENGRLRLRGTGFQAASPLIVRYHGDPILRTVSDSTGSLSATVPIPAHPQLPYHLVVTDAAGNYGSVNGLPATSLEYVVADRKLVITGRNFTPGKSVVITYHARQIASGVADSNGLVTVKASLPERTQRRYQLGATDASGRTAWVIGLDAPSIRFVVTGGLVHVTGQHFNSNSIVALTYHQVAVTHPRTSADGSFSAQFSLPASSRTGWQLSAVDDAGRRATATGLPASKR
jgi:Dolichyl-phosphate-mannose-protein mannosyltransferase